VSVVDAFRFAGDSGFATETGGKTSIKTMKNQREGGSPHMNFICGFKSVT
jgi:hypothetical protein